MRLLPLVFDIDQYCLLDFGEGRKLERFGEIVLDRPAPAAAGLASADRGLWTTAAARFIAAGDETAGCGQRGQWEGRSTPSNRWTIDHPPLVFELRLTEFGHVGVFPEQAENWDWIARQVSRTCGSPAPPSLHSGRRAAVAGAGRGRVESPRILNLFGYTGGSTLAAAAARAHVVHIDASKSTIGWGRRNAELSDLSSAPIRWIVEDARRFVAREAKRGNFYHGIILDPPSYGHGPKGETWQLDPDLPDLVAVCSALLSDRGFMLLTCHSAGFGPAELGRLLGESLPATRVGEIETKPLHLVCADGRLLHSGAVARWSSV